MQDEARIKVLEDLSRALREMGSEVYALNLPDRNELAIGFHELASRCRVMRLRLRYGPTHAILPDPEDDLPF